MKALAKFLALFVTSLVLFGGSVHSDHSFFSDGGSHHRPFSSYQLAETTTATPYYRPTNTYHQPKKPTQQNCTVEDEVLEAEICTPGKVKASCTIGQVIENRFHRRFYGGLVCYQGLQESSFYIILTLFQTCRPVPNCEAAENTV